MDEVTITVVGDAILTITEDLTICEGETATLTASSTEPGAFLWSNGAQTEIINVNPDSTADYSVTFSNACDVLSDSVIVNVIESVGVTILAEPDPGFTEIQQGDMLDLTALLDQAVNGATYTWSTGQTGQTITVSAIETPNSSYSVTVTTAEGCEYSVSISFSVEPADYGIPNVFTPDGDEVNDYFTVFSKGNVSCQRLQSI